MKDFFDLVETMRGEGMNPFVSLLLIPTLFVVACVLLATDKYKSRG